MSETTTANTKKNEAPAALSNFKKADEVENFYRFIHDNNLREEAHKLMEVVLKKITPPKKRGRKKATVQ